MKVVLRTTVAVDIFIQCVLFRKQRIHLQSYIEVVISGMIIPEKYKGSPTKFEPDHKELNLLTKEYYHEAYETITNFLKLKALLLPFLFRLVWYKKVFFLFHIEFRGLYPAYGKWFDEAQKFL